MPFFLGIVVNHLPLKTKIMTANPKKTVLCPLEEAGGTQAVMHPI